MNISLKLGLYVVLFNLSVSGAYSIAGGKELEVQIFDAIETNRESDVKRLIAKGANVNGHGNFSCHGDRTPLMEAVRKGNAELVRILLDAGADVNPLGRKDCGMSPLMYAAKYGHVEVVKILLAHGADVSTTDFEGWTALFFATSHNYETIVKMLIAAGAKVNVVDGYGNTPLDWAVAHEYTACIKILLANGAVKQGRCARLYYRSKLWLSLFFGKC